MKKIILFFILNLGVFSLNTSYGLSVHSPVKPAIPSLALSLRADNLIKFSPKQFSELTAKQLNLFQKLSFKILKLKIKHDLKKDPNLTLHDYYGDPGKKKVGAGWGILIIVGVVLLIITLVSLISLSII